MTTAAFASHEDFAAIATCSFCAGLAAGQRQRSTEEAVLDDENFVAWISVGALTEGHLLVVPRRHVLSCSRLDDDEQRELLNFVKRVKALLELRFGPTCLFEHGPARAGSAVGCSVDHAHLHLVPMAGSLVEAAIDGYPALPWELVSGGLRRGLQAAGPAPYLLAHDADGRTAVAVSEEIPSQALRRTIATRLGRAEEWDWNSHPQTRRILKTRAALAPVD